MSFFRNLFDKNNPLPDSKFNLNNFRFTSTDHVRYENGADNYGHQQGANRVIEIVKHESVRDAFKVTIYNLNENHPLTQSNIQMQPKRMEIISQSETMIKLRGIGNDPFGFSFSGYGLTLHLRDKEVEKVVLHMFERNVDIEYFK